MPALIMNDCFAAILLTWQNLSITVRQLHVCGEAFIVECLLSCDLRIDTNVKPTDRGIKR
ncbi:hypothetical protein Enr17x_23640 [Gimesia fumaroli]|uniref:Uncharacterized protein n=1 Tax=Gimesia fumaroli TaxID=2527976 RepID=A0A518IB45_9PLAN|nr:hypothetical protein Enr17x_23640 [Gimesia fumaroli]